MRGGNQGGRCGGGGPSEIESRRGRPGDGRAEGAAPPRTSEQAEAIAVADLSQARRACVHEGYQSGCAAGVHPIEHGCPAAPARYKSGVAQCIFIFYIFSRKLICSCDFWRSRPSYQWYSFLHAMNA